jgi:hypothetical protein
MNMEVVEECGGRAYMKRVRVPECSSSFIGMLIADGSDGYQIFDGAVALLSARSYHDSGLDYSL